MKNQALTYSLVIEEQDGGFLAYFPALPGCHTWGKTYQEAVTHAEEALSLYLGALMAHGDRVPRETNSDRSVSLGITVRTPVIA